MRTKKALINLFISILMGALVVTLNFINQRIFISVLGVNYLGINGLLGSVVSLLSIVEIGLGSAIIYHLYKPVRDNDTNKISALMAFYRRGYHIVALIILLLGLSVLPFLPIIIGKNTVPSNIFIVYTLFITDAVFSYMFSYKRSLLYADQKNYIINIVRASCSLALNVLQIALLFVTENYYIYLLVKVIMTSIENVVLNIIVKRKYRFVSSKEKPGVLDNITKTDIFKKIKGLLWHRLGTFFILGTDNIIISLFLGIAVVGLYSNYLLIITSLSTLYSQISTAITASIGNLLLEKNYKKNFIVYERIDFASFWLSVLIVTSFFVSMDSFISLWVGKQYLLPLSVLIALSLNLYLTLARLTLYSFKTAGGVFHEDKHIPIIESIVNLIFSLVFLKFFGLLGVFMGTICSALVVLLYGYPKFVYKNILRGKVIDYYVGFLKHLAVLSLISATTFMLTRIFRVESSFKQFIINLFLSIVVSNLILFVLFRKSKEMAYYSSMLGKKINTIKKYLLKYYSRRPFIYER